MWKTIEWSENDTVVMIDQTKLPREEVYVSCENYLDVAHAIKVMQIRGAPAIGVAAAMGVAIGALAIDETDVSAFKKKLSEVCEHLAGTRPTAVNLFWGIEKMKQVLKKNEGEPVDVLKRLLKDKAIEICHEDVKINEAMGTNGASFIPDGANILTHCNAGALATAGFGTALGVIRAAFNEGKKIHVYADETRPFLQGARLTAWELMKDNIPVTLITDNMAGYLMQQGKIDLVVVGSDRITSTGFVANKIGTYSVAVLAKKHGIPFYVAAPISTVDFDIADGSEVPIEEREIREVTHVFGEAIAPEGVKVFNPAFDVTPPELVSAIITEKGVAQAPFKEALAKQRAE